jgi:hypothetical protein
MANFTKEFLERTIEVWQPRYDYPLTLEDAREIAENMIGLFKLLDNLDKTHAR